MWGGGNCMAFRCDGQSLQPHLCGLHIQRVSVQTDMTPAKQGPTLYALLVQYLRVANADDCQGQALTRTLRFAGMPGWQQQSRTRHCSQPQLLRWLLHPTPDPVHAQLVCLVRLVGVQTLLPRPLHASTTVRLGHARSLQSRFGGLPMQPAFAAMKPSFCKQVACGLQRCMCVSGKAGMLAKVRTHRSGHGKAGNKRGAFVCQGHRWSQSPAHFVIA